MRHLRAGIRTNPSLELATALATVFGVGLAYFADVDPLDDALSSLRWSVGARAFHARGGTALTEDTVARIVAALDDADLS